MDDRQIGSGGFRSPASDSGDPLPPTLRSNLKDQTERHTYCVPMTELAGRTKERREALLKGTSKGQSKARHSTSNIVNHILHRAMLQTSCNNVISL